MRCDLETELRLIVLTMGHYLEYAHTAQRETLFKLHFTRTSMGTVSVNPKAHPKSTVSRTYFRVCEIFLYQAWQSFVQ